VSGQQHAPAALYPRERPGNHFTWGWVGPRAGLDGRKISSPPGFDPGPFQPVVSRYNDWATRLTTDIQYITAILEGKKNNVYEPHSNNIHQLYNTIPSPLQIKINKNDGFLHLFKTAIYLPRVTSGFRRGVNEIFAILGFYGAQTGSFVTYVMAQPIRPISKGPTVQDFRFLTMGPIGCPEMTVTKLPIYAA